MSSACCKKTFCAVVVSYGHKAGHECGLVVVQKCPNGLCSKHCPYKGGCDLHPAPPCHHVTDASDVAHWIEPPIMTLEPDSFPSKVHLPVPLTTYRAGYDLQLTPSCHHATNTLNVEVYLPMPPPTQSELVTRELREAMDKSLLPTVLDILPPFSSNSYDSATGLASSTMPSGFGPPLSFIPYVPSFPVVPSITSITVPTKIICPPPSTSLMTNAVHTKQRAVHLGLDDTVAN